MLRQYGRQFRDNAFSDESFLVVNRKLQMVNHLPAAHSAYMAVAICLPQ
jgi:hypothetical protein